jgi:hypothetical protein
LASGQAVFRGETSPVIRSHSVTGSRSFDRPRRKPCSHRHPKRGCCGRIAGGGSVLSVTSRCMMEFRALGATPARRRV